MDLSGCSGDIQVSIDYAQVSDLVFCKPPSSEKALFTTFVHKKYNIIPKGALKSQQVIGSGQFGAVHSGLLNTTSGFTKCAIKTLHEGHTPEDKVKFLQEAAIVGQFNHPQIVKLFGVVMDGPTTMIVLELLPLGDLRQHLIDIKLKLEKPSQDILQKSFLSYARQIAEGMNYLASKNFIHRDLAARNILMADENTCKIGDFGLSRDLVDEEFYLSRGGQIPMKWTSIEVLYIRRNLHTTCTICMSVFPQKRGRGVLRPPITLDSNTFNFNVVH
jgi:serine/threonine protein kinase